MRRRSSFQAKDAFAAAFGATAGSGRARRVVLVALAAVAVLAVAGSAVGYGVNAWLRDPYLFAVIGNDGDHLRQEQAAGVEAKVVRLSWRGYLPAQGRADTAYVGQKRAEIRRLREAGFEVILNLGFHDTPPWVHENYSDSYYVDQLGQRYGAEGLRDAGDANLVFNPQMRGLVDSYIRRVFSDLGTDFYAVRLGGGRYGELAYPPANYSDDTNLYWAYGQSAQQQAEQIGVAGWKPGSPSPNGEAERFLGWYLGELTGYQNWQIETVRQAGYGGRIMMLYPSWGVRPGQFEEAVAANLDGSTPAEVNGEIQRGHAFARQVAAIQDERVVVTTTWLDAPAAGDDDPDPRRWSPVKYLSSLAEPHPLSLEVYGENTGGGDEATMEFSARQMRRYGLAGMAWYDEQQLFSDRYASLADYERVIEASSGNGA